MRLGKVVKKCTQNKGDKKGYENANTFVTCSLKKNKFPNSNLFQDENVEFLLTK